MPCTPFSDTTILKILQCLQGNATTSASFRRTTQIVDILAKEYGLDQVHAETIQIGIWNDVEVEGIEIFGVQAAITIKRSKAERKKKKEKLLNGSNSCFTSLFTSSLITADFFLPEYPEKWYNYDKAVKAAYRVMKKVFEKAISVDCIHFEKMPLNEEFLKKFIEHRNCIKESTTFIFRNEREGTLNGCQITNMLNMMSLNSVHLATRFPAEIICLEDSHIYNLRSVILGAEHGEQMMEAPGITDTTLQYWKNNVPKGVQFNLVRTSFTLKAVWDYIEYVVAVKKNDLHYSFGVLSASTENRIALLQAQKTKYFNFAMNNSRFRRYQVVSYTFSYTGHVNKNLTFSFSMPP